MKSYGRPSGGVLGTLLDLRVEGERQAERALVAATEGRRAAEAEEGRLAAALSRARAALAAARLDVGELDGGGRAADAQARRRYGARLEAQAGAADEALAGHRANALARAIAADAAARAAHLRARQRREVVGKAIARREAAARRQAERREEAAADDLVRGARGAPRPPR
jgi:hypothetical protein